MLNSLRKSRCCSVGISAGFAIKVRNRFDGLRGSALRLLQELEPSLKLKYNKLHAGREKDGLAFNFVQFRPCRNHQIFELKLPETKGVSLKIDDYGVETLDYDKRKGCYRVWLNKESIKNSNEAFRYLSKLAYDHRVNG